MEEEQRFFDHDSVAGEGRGNLQRLRPIGEEVAEASRRIHQELGPCRRCQVKKNLVKQVNINYYFTHACLFIESLKILFYVAPEYRYHIPV